MLAAHEHVLAGVELGPHAGQQPPQVPLTAHPYSLPMAYDERLAERVRDVVQQRTGVTERKMFGGLAWMVGGNMACGLVNDGLLVRTPADDTEEALRRPHVREFGFPGRKPMRGFILVEPDGLTNDTDLAAWVDTGAGYAASLPPK
jgi:hypothetical protein